VDVYVSIEAEKNSWIIVDDTEKIGKENTRISSL
jgi:hypothetical protein